jgi:flagellar hook-length control protein FliK
MSSTPPATSASNPAHTATARAQGHAVRPGAAQGGSDLFSSLLALLSATHDAPTLGATDGENSGEAPGKGLALGADAADHNPLAGLLGWPGATPLAGSEGMPALASTARPQATSSGSLGQAELPGSKPEAATLAGRAPVQADTTAQGPTLQGMTLLEAPVAPDASTLAALGRAATDETLVKPKAFGSEAAARPAAWRSTVGTATHVAAQPLQHGQTAVSDRMHSAHQALVAQTRSTVALDERFALTQTSEVPLAAPGATASTGAGSATGGQPQGGGAGSPGAAPDNHSPDAVAERNEQPGSDAAFAANVPEAGEVVEASWGTPTLRHASLRVGEAGEDAIEIQLALSGQELNVEFRTDNSEARASLAQDASKSLADLLERSGIQLGNVSVGAQSQPQGEPGRSPQSAPNHPRGRAAASNDAAPATAPVEQRPRSDGSRPLDLFV